ncbi:MAG TPA: thiamine-phosphate kinase [Pyrinomonadaceae bacterium]|nr:thiamine-phosphate kinase [Pyrinomonadaceae bacterium]
MNDVKEDLTRATRGEFQFIDGLRQRAASSPGHSSLLAGIGDDAAIVRETTGLNTLVTSDMLVEEVDFHRDTTTPRYLGHKALTVSLSDIAAMGARPRWALVSLGVPDDIWNSDFVDHFYEGFFGLADRYGVALIGGDISRTPHKIVIDTTVMGQCDDGRAVLRKGAQPGDLIFVTGSLGGSAAGLRLLERGARVPADEAPPDNNDPDRHILRQLSLRHLRPDPRVGWGLVLGEEQLATSIIDISDGLSSDLHHLCRESGAGARIDAAKIPIDPLVTEICGRRALDPLLLALHGGEDFELLFTVAATNLSRLPRKVDGIAITQVGEIEPQAKRVCLAEGSRVWDLEPLGFQHF